MGGGGGELRGEGRTREEGYLIVGRKGSPRTGRKERGWGTRASGGGGETEKNERTPRPRRCGSRQKSIETKDGKGKGDEGARLKL